MNNLEQLESYAKDLASAVKNFSYHCRSTEIDSITAALPVVPAETDDQVQQARRNILTTVAKIQALISKPDDFLQNLASQVRPLCTTHSVEDHEIDTLLTFARSHCRSSCSEVYNGLVNFKFLLAYLSVAVYL